MSEQNSSPVQLPQALNTFVRRGVYTLNIADARRVGITSSQVHRWKKRGFLRALGGGAYVIQAPLVSTTERRARVEEHLRAARAVVDGIEGAYLTGRSAALGHDLPVYNHPQLVEFTRRPWVRTAREDLLSRRPWGSAPLVRPDGLRLQRVAECVVEIAGREGTLAGLVTGDAALALKLVTEDELPEAMQRYGSRIGAENVRRVVRLADARTESPAESTCRWAFCLANIAVTPQVHILDERGAFVARVDFLVDGTRVVVEVDGLEKYVDEDEQEYETHRQMRLEALGYTVIRVRTADLHALHHVVERVRVAMRRACPRPDEQKSQK